MGLFSGEIVFRGALYWGEFCVSKWIGLDNKKTAKNTKIIARVNHNNCGDFFKTCSLVNFQ